MPTIAVLLCEPQSMSLEHTCTQGTVDYVSNICMHIYQYITQGATGIGEDTRSKGISIFKIITTENLPELGKGQST